MKMTEVRKMGSEHPMMEDMERSVVVLTESGCYVEKGPMRFYFGEKGKRRMEQWFDNAGGLCTREAMEFSGWELGLGGLPINITND